MAEDLRLGIKKPLGTEKGTMKEFIGTELAIIMKNLKVKKRVSYKFYLKQLFDSLLFMGSSYLGTTLSVRQTDILKTSVPCLKLFS